jgi:hypothetical protein
LKGRAAGREAPPHDRTTHDGGPHSTPISSTSKIRVESGGITGGRLHPIRRRRRDRQPAALADLHARHPLIPTLDDLADPDRDRERLTPVSELSNCFPFCSVPV